MKMKQGWIMFMAGVLCLCGFSIAIAEEQPAHKVTPQEVAEALADPSANITYFNLTYRGYMDVGPWEDSNAEMRLNFAGFLKLPNDTSILYRAYLPWYSTKHPDDSGIGDALLSAYWVPTKGNLILGYGGAVITPTAAEDYYGTGKWSAGPTLVLAKKVPGRYTVGGLLTHVWSFAGDGDRESVSMTTIQPAVTLFVNKKGSSVIFGSETTYNWKADEDPWQVPLTVGVGQILPPVGRYFIGVLLAGTYYIEKNDFSPEWDWRAMVSFVFP